jgi:hypothetical protein
MMNAKHGFTVIVDYLMSLAYFGCTLKHGLRDSDTGELNHDRAELVSKELLVQDFVEMLDASCFFYFSDPKNPEKSACCNLSPGASATLRYLCKVLRDEEGSFPDDVDCLSRIFKHRIDGEKVAAKNESMGDNEWFTESDRIIRKLLYERQPAPMVIVRVYDNDENRSMQQIMRHAMEVCGLNKSRERRSDIPAFSVISNISDTKLLAVLEPYYRSEYDVGGNRFLKDIPRMRVGKERNENAKAVINYDLKYEDLLNVPCMIILCEKGRMGDTFPHTLSIVDLRLR